MLGKSVCILFSGKAGTGKSTSATYLHNKLFIMNETIIESFAHGVKATAKESFGWNGIKDPAGRKLLQDIGRTGRAYNKNMWVDKTFHEYLEGNLHYPFDYVLIDDCRYENEINYVKDNPLYSVYTVRIDAPNRESLKGTDAYADESEVDLDEYTFDFVINNRGTFDELYEQLDTVIESIKSKEKQFGD